MKALLLFTCTMVALSVSAGDLTIKTTPEQDKMLQAQAEALKGSRPDATSATVVEEILGKHLKPPAIPVVIHNVKKTVYHPPVGPPPMAQIPPYLVQPPQQNMVLLDKLSRLLSENALSEKTLNNIAALLP